MKIPVNQPLEVDFDPQSIEQAGHVLDDVRIKYREQADDVLQGLLTLLIHWQLEAQHPGTLQKILDALHPDRGGQL